MPCFAVSYVGEKECLDEACEAIRVREDVHPPGDDHISVATPKGSTRHLDCRKARRTGGVTAKA